MRNQQHDPSLSHDAGTHLPGTAVSGGEMGAAGRGVEGGRAVSVVSRNPRSETDARLVARFGAKRTVSRTVAHGPGRYGRRPNSWALPSEGRSNQVQEFDRKGNLEMSKRTPRRNIRILRQPEVTEMTGLSRTTIWRRIGNGSFPRHVRLGPEGSRAVGWLHHEVQDWLNGLRPAA